jgi:hypothetical protein
MLINLANCDPKSKPSHRLHLHPHPEGNRKWPPSRMREQMHGRHPLILYPGEIVG